MPLTNIINPTQLADLFEVENILCFTWPARVNAMASFPKRQQCSKEFEALRMKFNQTVNHPTLAEGIVPLQRMIQAGGNIYNLVGGWSEKHGRLLKEAKALAEKWGHSQNFRAVPAANYAHLKQKTPRIARKAVPVGYKHLNEQKTSPLSFRAGPSASWDMPSFY